MHRIGDSELRSQRAVGAGLSTVWALPHSARRDVASAGHLKRQPETQISDDKENTNVELV